MKIRVGNNHEEKKVEEENDSGDIPKDVTMEDHHHSDIKNSGRYYGNVLRD